MELRELLREQQILRFGVCSFQRIPHLLPCRAAARLPENAVSVIICAFDYYIAGTEHRNLSRYAIVPDYHIVVGELLQNACAVLEQQFPGHYAPFVDNSPIPEVSTAAQAGLGVIGDNGLLITPDAGSYVFLGEIVTDVEFPETGGKTGHCLHCGACRFHCPNRAIVENGIERERCLSHITQKKGELTEEEKALICRSGCAWGCDICQDVCPMNRRSFSTDLTQFSTSVVENLSVSTVDDIFRGRAFSYRKPEVIKRNLRILGR